MHATILFLTTLLSAAAVSAAAVNPRQIGGIACNVARLQVVGALSDAGDAIGQIADADVQSAAQAGLDQANGGIDAIAQSIIAGEKASADGRTNVEAGLTAMADALASGDA